MKNAKLWSGLTSVFAVILVIALIGNTLATANASYINSTLGINTARVVEKGTAPTDTTYYKRRFGAFDDAEAQAKVIAAALEQNVNEMREGAALLLNRENALPMANETKISVFGHGAVDPAYQASSAGTKVKTGAINAIDLKTALESQGFQVNETLWNGLLSGKAGPRPLAKPCQKRRGQNFHADCGHLRIAEHRKDKPLYVRDCQRLFLGNPKFRQPAKALGHSL